MFRKKTCLVTGGSSGLGLAIAQEALQRGANVLLLARNEDNLLKAKLSLCIPEGQFVQVLSADVTKYHDLIEAFTSVGELAVDYLFCCAGICLPGKFLDQSIDDFAFSMNLNYLGTVYTIRAFLQVFCNWNNVFCKRKQKIVLVSSTAGFLSFYGHSSYAPTKHAIRSLGDCLRHELDISTGGKITTHVYFTSTISSPGFQVEQARAPLITKLIEGTGVNDGCSPKKRAITLLNGIEGGKFHITSDFATDLLRVSMAGVSPRNGIVRDTILLVLAWLFIPLWRIYIDVFVVGKNQ